MNKVKNLSFLWRAFKQIGLPAILQLLVAGFNASSVLVVHLFAAAADIIPIFIVMFLIELCCFFVIGLRVEVIISLFIRDRPVHWRNRGFTMIAVKPFAAWAFQMAARLRVILCVID